MSTEVAPKPGAGPRSIAPRESNPGAKPLAWSKLRSEPYYTQPITVDLGVRAATPEHAIELLEAELKRVYAQLRALAAVNSGQV